MTGHVDLATAQALERAGYERLEGEAAYLTLVNGVIVRHAEPTILEALMWLEREKGWGWWRQQESSKRAVPETWFATPIDKAAPLLKALTPEALLAALLERLP